MRNDWADDARRFEDIDHAALAEIEGRDAIEYRKVHGLLPQGLSVRAARWIEAYDQTQPAPRIVAACWTCANPTTGKPFRVSCYPGDTTCPSEHRAAGHDVREAKP